MFWYVISVAIGYYLFRTLRKQYYWSRKNVKQSFPIPFIGDFVWVLLRMESTTENIKRIYSKFPNERYNGTYAFTSPFLVVRDPDLIKMIAVKDFDHFTDHRPFIPDDVDPIWGRNVFSLTGDKWRNMRATLSPAFTSSKMKIMFSLINECAEQFTDYFLNQEEKLIKVEMKDALSRYSSDMIATCTFGVKCDSLKDRDNEFFKKGVQMADFSSLETVMAFFISIISTTLLRVLKLRIIPKTVSDFFYDIITKTINVRLEKKIYRPDMLHLLLEARKGRLNHDEEVETKQEGFSVVEESNVVNRDKKTVVELTDVDITAQALIFFFAGSDTVSTLLSFLMYELAINPEIQNKLYEEIDKINSECNGKFAFDAIAKMQYLDMIISEALRKWPPMAATDRVCTKPYTIEPVGPEESPLHLEVGDLINLPTYGLHHDPKYFPEPERFDPERFNETNKHNIKPYTYLPFGLGPRSCIGSRLALVAMKTVVFHLLLKFEVTVIEETSIPLKLHRSSLTMRAVNGIWVGLKKRE